MGHTDGTLRGGRLHFGWCPVSSPTADGAARRDLVLGVDLRLLGGAGDFILGSGFLPESYTYGGPFMFSPMVTVSIQRF